LGSTGYHRPRHPPATYTYSFALVRELCDRSCPNSATDRLAQYLFSIGRVDAARFGDISI
jgi:hypothetical protein